MRMAHLVSQKGLFPPLSYGALVILVLMVHQVRSHAPGTLAGVPGVEPKGLERGLSIGSVPGVCKGQMTPTLPKGMRNEFVYPIYM